IIKEDYVIQLIRYLVVLAAITKRAQIPFSSWLPAAIAAPTPVSSLVHSSTLVTAGVYLLIRFNFSFSNNLIIILLFISSITIFISGLGANFEFDLKKIIALSTLRQLGLIISILALGEYKLAFFHLLIHALFKALLFMCAGNIIHNLFNCQDIRFIGGLVKHLPLTCTYLNICNLSLCGLPFISGFYSKDLVVEFISINYLNIYIYLIFYISIGLTVSYRFRLTYYSIIGNFNFISLHIIQERRIIILKGIRGLILFVIFRGSIFSWLLFSTPYFICLTFFIKILTLFVIIIGGWLGYELAKFKLSYQLLTLKFLTSSLFISII
ncbi:NADH-ubiquinone oxidoreductase chain 5-like, partial [Diorhabda sublineata]|uniref:NADH-ubiquinone oxidoreductase chain 5-like n=1 Tax=Diorhabda sublineata TaxID=1163346 RepID=UPI0024E11824